jgi:hypothetical protein
MGIEDRRCEANGRNPGTINGQNSAVRTSKRRFVMRLWRIGVPGLFAIAFALSTSSLFAQAADPVTGTWELNVAKSKLAGGPLPRSQTRKYEVIGQQVKSVQKGVDAEGKPTLVQFTASLDGKDYPYTGSPDFDTLALTRVDKSTLSFTQKRAGKVALTGTTVVSKDGKTMTISGKGTNAKGQPMDVVYVFDKR